MDANSYNYTNYIRSPAEMGMSADGNIQTLENDVNGLIAYTELLVEGTGKASKTGKPLGNKYFFNTQTTCKDMTTNQNVNRYIYINNVPDGNFPLLSATSGQDYSQFEGLIPGILSDLANMEPMDPQKVFQSFQQNGGLACQQVTLQTVNGNNQVSSETQYLATLDIENMDPCEFENSVNPVTNVRCKEGFKKLEKQNDLYVQSYLVLVSILFIFLFANVLIKNKMLTPI